MKKEVGCVISQENIATDIYSMWIETSVAEEAKPGQFLSVYTKSDSMLLPRPISICEVNEERTALRIVYRVVGKGTAEFSWYEDGEDISILGPIGNGFPVEAVKEGNRVFLIGGGIGIPPMLQLAKQLSCEKDIILGYRDELFLNNELASYGNVFVATEDGSAGSKGNIMNCILDNKLNADIIFACGPMPMLRAIKAYAKEQGIKAYISLEERMACGVGACLGCVCKTKEKDHHSHVNNARVCTDGPVFEAEEVMI
ncbi:MAG: dihydroorotate dehydrogenase electron transfer subunit [Lachnospiraceae bacterium]|nr:dihydroorotate dehydrogenase electron transfer subunit [Lachnospiraceae bacterium]